MGEQWRENVTHSRTGGGLATAFPRGDRREPHRGGSRQGLPRRIAEKPAAYLAADPKARQIDSVQIRGLQPVFFDQTAWDLALATQSLAHIDPQIAFGLSRIYGLQRTYGDLTGRIMQAIYLRPVTENFDGLVAYFGDLVLWEPKLLQMYDEVLPEIDRALGTSR